MQRFSIFLVLLNIIWCQAFTQVRNTLSGKVTDQINGTPLAGASVIIADLKVGVITDTSGVYRFKSLPPGRHLLEVSYVGYSSFSAYVQVLPETIADFTLSPSVVENDEVVVTGITAATQARRNPVPVTIVKQQELMRTVSTNLIDALRNKPGISQVSTGPAVSKPVIRGLGYNRVIVLNDGIRQEGQQWGDEHGVEIDEQSVQKVEILKGPASLMYGSDAMAGVLNIITNVPVQEGIMKGAVSTNYQTNNQLRSLHLDLGANHKGFSWSTYGSYKAAADYRNKYDGRVYNSRFNEKNVGGYLGYNGSWGYSHLLLSNFHQQLGMVEGERNEYGQFLKLLPGGMQGVATGNDFKKIQPDVPMQEINHFRVVSDNRIQVGQNRLGLTFGYQQNRRMEYGNPDDPEEKELYFDLNTITYSSVFHLKQYNGWNFSMGMNGLFQNNKNRGEEVLIPEYSTRDAGFFSFFQKTMDKLSISGGLRFDNRVINAKKHIQDGDLKFEALSRDFSNISGSAGISFLPSSSVTFKLNISRGFRAPSIPELSSNGAHEGTNRYEYGNPDLASETSFQLDLGMEFNSEHISLATSLFSNNINNFIFYRKLESVTGNDSLVDGNMAFRFDQRNASLAGFEAVIDIHPHPLDWLHFENTFSFVRGKFREALEGNNNIPFIPAASWLSEVRADFEGDGRLLRNLSLKIQLDKTLSQKKAFTVYNTETPTVGYALLNAAVSTDILARKKTIARLYFNVMNIGDVAFQGHLNRLKYAPENPVTGRMGVFQMGRNFSLKIQVPISVKL